MHQEVVEALEGFVERGEMWNVLAMEHVVAILEEETARSGDPNPAMLAKVFAAILMRSRMGPMREQLAYDVEAHVYQRLDKVLEAVHEGLPGAEVRTRIEVFHRRLSRMIVDEDPRPVDSGG